MKKFFYLFAFIIIAGCSKEDNPSPTPTPEPDKDPVANADALSAVQDEPYTFEDDILLDNDDIVDNARIFDLDTETTEGGTVEDNRDGTYTYTPASGFKGDDTFTYTICVPGDSDRCSTAKVTVTVGDAGEPVAQDDAYQVDEDKSLEIKNYLENDTVIDNAVVTEVTAESGNATVTLQEDGSILYQPNTGFSGEDTFTYTLCDDDDAPNCSTATITMTVVDTGSPSAEDDTEIVEFGTSAVTFDDLLANDDLLDDATLSSIDDTGSKGTITLNADGTITYKPASGFKGDDTFTYTICDDDAVATCSTATVTVSVVEAVSFNIPASLQDYYDSMVFISNSDLLYTSLAEFTTTMHVNRLEYSDRHDYLYDADADPDDASMVILMYSGEKRPDDEYQLGDLSEGETYNTEHIYPQSLLNEDEAANDMHHMRVADTEVNSERLNYPYTDGSGEYKLVNGNSWYPGDDWRGDVARMVMYVNLRYGDEFNEVGSLELFLEWNREDPVSEFEMQRNDVIEGAQGNRNPFIDNPYLATMIWGGAAAENRWE
ncbi:MAG: Ig-like domain-containing protein [Christiangramia sp.]|uniref:Ig-like domain-containing protein n=1 Tax=Christiangramia sp. TaxID=1931228 RepID=UPI0032422258